MCRAVGGDDRGLGRRTSFYRRSNRSLHSTGAAAKSGAIGPPIRYHRPAPIRGAVPSRDPMNRVTSASVSVFGQGGASPFQAYALRPVTEGNCVAARRGGKQPEVNDQSVTQVNSIRPCQSASRLVNGEAQTGAIRKPTTLKGSVSKRSWGWWGGWRRNGWKARHMKQRDLSGPTGVHCPR